MKFCRVLLETSQRQGTDFRKLHVFYKLTKKGIKNLPDKSADAGCEAEAQFAEQFLEHVNALRSLRSGAYLILIQFQMYSSQDGYAMCAQVSSMLSSACFH